MAGVRLFCSQGAFVKRGGSKGRIVLLLCMALGGTIPVGSRMDGDLGNTPGAVWVCVQPKRSWHAQGARVLRKEPEP